MPVARPSAKKRSRSGAMVSERPGTPYSASGVRTVLFDTNVVLDVVLQRAPWSAASARALDLAGSGAVAGLIASHAVTTVYYLIARSVGRSRALTAIRELLTVLTVVELGTDDFRRALALGLPDFEDAVQVAACLRAGAQVLVTRNGADFKGAPVEVRAPAELFAVEGGSGK